MAEGDVQLAVELFLDHGEGDGSEEEGDGSEEDGEGNAGSDEDAGNGYEESAESEPEGIDVIGSTAATRGQRIDKLTAHLLSPEVQVQIPQEAQEVPARLSLEEVAEVVRRHVPGVDQFLYRGQDGDYSLGFMQTAYMDGLAAFRDTPVHTHLLWLLRLIVHHGQENTPGASRQLQQVAEAFMDCQAVQGRVIERVGLEISGVAPDFRGLLVAFVGEYKGLALKMLAAERIQAGVQGHDEEDEDPAHYENRLITDLGRRLGLNSDDIRRAALDNHANARYSRLRIRSERINARRRFRELFDIEALLKAFEAEVNMFNADSPVSSLPGLFLKCVSDRMTQKHVVFDEDTCTRVDVTGELVLAIFEAVFLGGPCAPAEETYRGEKINDLFRAG